MLLDNLSNEVKNDLIDKLVNNLPTLRTKMNISQSQLAYAIGIGRQTLIAIENRKGKMRWDTFLALILVFSKDRDASELMTLLGLHLQDIETRIHDDIIIRKGGSNMKLDKIWTDNTYKGDTTIRGLVPVPIGLRNYKCPKCQSKNIRGALIMPTADEQDPNIVCLDCGYWWD
jgi:DNA-binding XRE family transcriptional regulator